MWQEPRVYDPIDIYICINIYIYVYLSFFKYSYQIMNITKCILYLCIHACIADCCSICILVSQPVHCV